MASNFAEVIVTINEAGSPGSLMTVVEPPAWVKASEQGSSLCLFSNGLVQARYQGREAIVFPIEQLESIVEAWQERRS